MSHHQRNRNHERQASRKNWHLLSDRKRKVIIAVANGDVETVKLNLNKEDCIYPLFEGNSVLIVASQNKTPSIYGMLEFLTEANHYPEGWISLQDNYGLTPLMYCAFHNNLEGMKAWLRIFPTSYMELSFDGSSPITLAASNGNFEGFKMLRQHGADPNDRGHNNTNCLIAACNNNKNQDLIKYLLKECKIAIDVQDDDGYAAIHAVCKHGNLEILNILLDKGATVDVCTREGYSPLMLAAMNSHRKIVKMLLKEFTDLELSIRNGKTAIALAAEHGDAKIVKDLLYANAHPEPESMEEGSPMLLACQQGHLGVIQVLARSPNVNLQFRDKRGRTGFSMAAANGHFHVLRFLVRKGAKGKERDQITNWLETVDSMEDIGHGLDCAQKIHAQKIAFKRDKEEQLAEKEVELPRVEIDIDFYKSSSS